MRTLYLSHVFLRDLSYSVGVLGWVYLFDAGVPLTVLMGALLGFRLFESFVCMPVAHRLAHRYPAKTLLSLSILLQVGIILLFPIAAQWHVFLLLIILFLSLYDVIYWPARDNLERLIAVGSLPSRIGLSRATTVGAQAVGYSLGGLGIVSLGSDTFAWAAVGLTLSGIPLLLLTMPSALSAKTSQPFFTTIMFHKKVPLFVRSHAVLLIASAAITKEITDHLLPIALAFASLDLVEIGYLMGIFVVCHFTADVLAGYAPEKYRHNMFTFFGLFSLALFLIFLTLPHTYLSLFFILLAFFAGPFFTIVDVYVQAFVLRHNIPSISGGFFIEFVDDTARAAPYMLFFVFPLLVSAPAFIFGLLSIGALTTTGTLLVGLKRIRD